MLRRLLAPISDDLRGLRDKALLLMGFAGALRRSELAAIEIKDLEATERGLRLTLMQTKGSQAKAVTVPLPYGDTELCPVRSLERWLAEQPSPKDQCSDGFGFRLRLSKLDQPAPAWPSCANSAIGGAGGPGSCCRGEFRTERSRWS